MQLVRQFEERVSVLYRDGVVPGFVHLSLGQEGTAVGACWPLRDTDIITSTHRGHGHCLAKGLDPTAMFAELMGRATGTNRGRGGSMHIADPERGVFGANGIVAAGLPIAVGAAVAARIAERDDVVVAFFGDGAVAHGAFHEAVNLAVLWNLPVILFCENNGFAEFSSASEQHPVSLETRARGYGLPFHRIDGNDVEGVAALATGLVERARAGAGPVLVEAVTYRWHGHYEGDPERYRHAEETERWRRDRDPIALTRSRLVAQGVSAASLDGIDREIAESIADALAGARCGPVPTPDTLHHFVLRRSPPPEGTLPGDGTENLGEAGVEETFRLMDAVHDALAEALENDDKVYLAGIDVGAGGNVFGITRGLKSRWPNRVLDTPISETAIVGLAVGGAMAGMHPVVEIMYLDFIGACFDQLLNQAAKLPFMTGGRAQMSLTVRTQFGAGRSSGSQHSQSLEVLLAHIAGLKVVMPSTPAEAYGLLRASIADPDPVIFIEHRLLYGMRGRKPSVDHIVPLGRARVARPGRDITVVSYSRMVHEALAAADELSDLGVDTEVIDLRTVAPIDMGTVHRSVAKTSRLVVAHEAVMGHGVGAEIAAAVADQSFWNLDAPIKRVGAQQTPPPYSPDLERAWLPDRRAIVSAVLETISV
ncbi:MAG: dehydrogenase E1 component subunit alpha/beta [Actinomycetota bacterium]|nr:dehydrogenase E1 component subunit alpha/beta [Actinomycetota bacterium]